MSTPVRSAAWRFEPKPFAVGYSSGLWDSVVVRMRVRMGLVAVSVLLIALSGDATAAPSASTPQAARRCLSAAGLRVVGGAVDKQESNGTGAVAELVVNSAFIAFYPSKAVADHALPAIEKNAIRLRGSVVHRGNATIIFVGTPVTTHRRKTIVNCTF
jgi:hypothetical protein